MPDFAQSALALLYQRIGAAVAMAATLRRDGTPLSTALQQTEHRVRALELPVGLPDSAADAARAEQQMMLDLVRRARIEPDIACAGQDPLDWLAMVVEDRRRQLTSPKA